MGVIEKEQDGKIYFQIKELNLHSNIKHIFTSRIGWNQKNIFKDLAQILNISENKVYRSKQVHGNEVSVIKNQDYKEICSVEKDGFVTDVKGIALATYHADCVPIYFYDPIKKAIGLAHAGWKGTLNNIVKSVVDKMIEEYQSKLENIEVAIGPSICLFCYEIGQSLAEEFLEIYSNNSEIIMEENGKCCLDLWKANKINLVELGIKEKNIYNSEFCTSCEVDKLFSYRKENKTKNRMIAAIVLEN